MATGRISKRAVDVFNAGAANAFLWDDELSGFGLKVTPAGAKSYVYQYRVGGRGSPTRRYTIGRHGKLTPDQARAVAKELAADVAKGLDPLERQKEDQGRREAERRAAAEEERRLTELAFASYASRFLEAYKHTVRAGTYTNAELALRLHVTPKLGNTPLPEITADDVQGVLDALPRNRPALRRGVYAVLSRIFRSAVPRIIQRSPLEGVDAPPAAAARDRVLSPDELRLAWLASADLGKPFGQFYRVLIVTGQRRDEVAGMNWRELDRGKGEWTLPKERSKNGVASIVPLPSLAIAELDGLAGGEKWPSKGLVFTTTGKTPISGYSRAKQRIDEAMLSRGRAEAEAAGDDPGEVELAPWRIHDIRRTLATGLQKLGIRFEVTESVLNHTSGKSKTGVAAVYQRHDWADEKRDALEKWARRIDSLLRGREESNVVSLIRHKA